LAAAIGFKNFKEAEGASVNFVPRYFALLGEASLNKHDLVASNSTRPDKDFFLTIIFKIRIGDPFVTMRCRPQAR
jgi:hypothetical protein